MKTSAVLSSKKKGVVALALLTLSVAGCQRSAPQSETITDANVVTNGNANVERVIGDSETQYQILGSAAAAAKIKNKAILTARSLEGSKRLGDLSKGQCPANAAPAVDNRGTNEEPVTPPAPQPDSSLLMGLPINLLGEHQVFGGVITTVSDKVSEDLGTLKLTDLAPLHVRPQVLRVSETEYVLGLMGCVRECTEGSAQLPLITIPIVGVDEEKNTVVLDLASLGKELNLIEMMDPDGEYTKLKTKESKTVSFDYSLSTLVFDVAVKMIPLAADPTASGVPETEFKIRWYLKLVSAFNPAFETRTATNGVGFFMTERSLVPKITRFSRFITGGGVAPSGPVKYFVKNVPQAHRAAFKASFDEWNVKFTAITGAPLLSYEFLEANDPRNALLVPGDVRYNILEWDLVNKAGYGGLGPSIANQFTGETMSANVLIQGPTIIELYTKWFKATTRANELREEGDEAAAQEVLAQTLREIDARRGKRSAKSFKLALRDVDFRINAQRPELQDPLFERDDFEEIPAGVTFDTYMAGYFQEMVSHELGHNVGLRHNFRGNLGSTGLELGHVSHSIMEYLGRGFRHLNRISEYDVMAVKYGYLGIQPNKTNLFCTDDQVGSVDKEDASPECSKEDATSDPFGFFEQRLARSTDLLVGRGLTTAPVWLVSDVTRELTAAVQGLGLYAARAELTGAGWTNFFTGGDRPTSIAQVKGYTLAKLKAKLCDPSFAQVVAGKASPDAQAKTLANIKSLREKAAELLAPLLAGEVAALSCGSM